MDQEITSFADLLDDGLMIIARDAEIIFANKLAEDYVGQNLAGRLIFTVISSDEFKAFFTDAVDSEMTSEMYYQPPGAMPREFRIHIKPISDDRFLLLLRDLTLHGNIEKMRRDFVANVSHELRSPLTSLSGFIETLLDDDVPDPAMRTRFLKIMEEEAQRMARLIDDLLSLSRVEAEEHIKPDGDVRLGILLETVIATLKPRASQRDIDITLEVDSALPASLMIQGSHDEMTEVFVNLIDNAIKYAFTQSLVTVRVTGSDMHYLRVDVINHGEGVEDRHIPRLTERFYRVDKARSRQVGGTGLGLAIVKHIVTRHRGKLLIESTTGKTTIFSVLLPTAILSDSL
jgi:two-component system phosphate regulon sensor histidine kinase PhoR